MEYGEIGTVSTTASDGTASTTASDGTASGGEPKRSGWWGIGNSGKRSRNDSSGNTDSESGGRPAEAGTEETPFVLGESRVTIDAPTEKPKRTYTKRASKAGPITATDVENYLKLGFGWIALAKQAPWWEIDDPHAEAGSFSPQAAVLLNRYLAEHAQKVKDGADVGSVAFGMLMLVYSRMQMDTLMRREAVKARKAELQREEGIPEDLPQSTTSRNGASDQGKIREPLAFGGSNGTT